MSPPKGAGCYCYNNERNAQGKAAQSFYVTRQIEFRYLERTSSCSQGDSQERFVISTTASELLPSASVTVRFVYSEVFI